MTIPEFLSELRQLVQDGRVRFQTYMGIIRVVGVGFPDCDCPIEVVGHSRGLRSEMCAYECADAMGMDRSATNRIVESADSVSADFRAQLLEACGLEEYWGQQEKGVEP